MEPTERARRLEAPHRPCESAGADGRRTRFEAKGDPSSARCKLAPEASPGSGGLPGSRRDAIFELPPVGAPPTRTACLYCGGRPVEDENIPPLRAQLEVGVRACPQCHVLVPPARSTCARCSARPVLLNFDPNLPEAERSSLLARITEGGVDLLFTVLDASLTLSILD